MSEVFLRVFFGFCNAILYREDKDFEYIAIPQKTKRFGNDIFYNSYSQRNEEISLEDSVIIGGLGDSVINGGATTDDDSLATTKLGKYLTRRTGKKVKVLNISCQSWGPSNCLAYLKKYGDFNAKAMFLVMSSHDVYDNMEFDKVVGANLSYPDKQYKLAISELLERYVLPRFVSNSTGKASAGAAGIKRKTSKYIFDPGILDLYRYCKRKNLPFLIYLHADKEETENKIYSQEGGLLDSVCKEYQIPLIKELTYDLPVEAYRDNIHLSDIGQEKMFEILKDKIYH